MIAGVKVKIAGLQPATSNSKGYRINVPKATRTLKFSKNGYTTISVKRTVTRAMNIDVLMTATSGAALSSVSLSDNDVPVGTVVNGTVTLNNAAPSGGAKISLSSTSPATATVASSIQSGRQENRHVPSKRQAAGTAVIKATYNNASKTANLKVTGGDTTQPTQTPTPTPIRRPRPRLRSRNSNPAQSQCPVDENPNGWCPREMHLRCE